MTRTTINKSALAIAASALLLIAATLIGCSSSDDFHRKDLGLDSPTAKQITQLLDALHHLDDAQLDAYLDQHLASGLSDGQRAGLRATFAQLAAANEVKLASLDRFGSAIYRAQLHLITPAADRTLNLLLVPVDHDLRWAGLN